MLGGVTPAKLMGLIVRGAKTLDTLESATNEAREKVWKLEDELRSIDFVTRLLDAGHLDSTRYKKINLHVIHGDEPLKEMSASSKVNAEWEFLTTLRDLGKAAAAGWLERDFDTVGERSSVNLREMFGGYMPPPEAAGTGTG